MPDLFTPFRSRGLTLPNRLVMSPMCQYSALEDGTATDWHFVHYGARANGRIGLIIVEMTQVQPNGRLSPGDLGLWSDAQIEPLRRIVDYAHSQGVPIGVQLGHAGRKADPVYDNVAPSAIAFSDRYRTPAALDEAGIREVVEAFAAAARRALRAGFDLIELHGAHGYLLNQFLSPLTNRRDDAYGGDFERRLRFPLEVAEAVRRELPDAFPLWLRLSALEHHPEGYTLEDTVAVARRMAAVGIDLVDVSSGGNLKVAGPEETPGYRVPYAEAVRQGAKVPVMAVGRLESPELADAVIRAQRVDLVAVARGVLRDANLAQTAALRLGREPDPPEQYERAYSVQL